MPNTIGVEIIAKMYNIESYKLTRFATGRFRIFIKRYISKTVKKNP